MVIQNEIRESINGVESCLSNIKTAIINVNNVLTEIQIGNGGNLENCKLIYNMIPARLEICRSFLSIFPTEINMKKLTFQSIITKIEADYQQLGSRFTTLFHQKIPSLPVTQNNFNPLFVSQGIPQSPILMLPRRIDVGPQTTIRSIGNNEIFQKTFPSMGTSDFNALMMRLENSFAYRKVFGDGHCMFRAIAYAFALHLRTINKGNRNEQLNLIEEKISSMAVKHPNLDNAWKVAKSIWINPIQINDTDTLVAFLRLLACSFNQTHYTYAEFQNFLTSSETSQAYFESMSNMSKARYGGQQELIAISNMLGCEIDIIALDTLANFKDSMLINDCNRFNPEANECTLYLLHYGIHYDLAILIEEEDENDESESSDLNGFRSGEESDQEINSEIAKIKEEVKAKMEAESKFLIIEDYQPNLKVAGSSFPELMLAFQQNEGNNFEEISLQNMWEWDSKERKCQDISYIDWLFPNDIQGSPWSKKERVCSLELINQLKTDQKVIQNIKHSFKVILKHFGFNYKNYNVEKAPNFEEQSTTWLTPNSLDLTAISHILRSLKCMGLNEEADAFFAMLTDMCYGEKPIECLLTYFVQWNDIMDS